MTLIKSAVINLSDGGQCEAAAATNSLYPGRGGGRVTWGEGQMVCRALNFTVLAILHGY